MSALLSDSTYTPPMHYHYLSDDFNNGSVSECEPGNPDLHAGSDTFRLIESEPTLHAEGWGIFPLLTPDEFVALQSKLTHHVHQLLAAHGEVSPDFTLENYHRHVTDATHYAVSSWAMLAEVISPLYPRIKERAEHILGKPLHTKEIEHRGEKGHFLGFRLVRPGKSDHNPFHRDAWLPYWRDTVNVWLPVCGFESGNTLCVLPQTHRLNDAEILKTKQGAVVNGKTYHVPAAVALTQPVTPIHPQLTAGQGLLFSPYLLHGNGVNRLPDTTRVSIEIRFCAAD